jgi:hypothetical protein
LFSPPLLINVRQKDAETKMNISVSSLLFVARHVKFISVTADTFRPLLVDQAPPSKREERGNEMSRMSEILLLFSKAAE